MLNSLEKNIYIYIKIPIFIGRKIPYIWTRWVALVFHCVCDWHTPLMNLLWSSHSALSLAKSVVNELLLWLFLNAGMTAVFQFYYCPDRVKSRSKLGNIQQKPELPYFNPSFPLLCSVLLFSLISISSDRKSHWLEAFRGCGIRVKQRHGSTTSAAHNNRSEEII